MEELREYAKELLEKGEVAAVIGYTQVTERRTKPMAYYGAYLSRWRHAFFDQCF